MLFNTMKSLRKPTEEEIKKWMAGTLDHKQMRQVTAGLLFYKNKDIQKFLQESFLESPQ